MYDLMPATEEMTALVNRFYEEVANGQDIDLLEDLLTPGFISHNFPLPYSNGFAFGEGLRCLTDGFPDFRMVIEDQSCTGDRVFSRGFWTGTHLGYFQRMPATGRRVKIQFMDEWRIADDQLAENWLVADYLQLMLQLDSASLLTNHS